MPEVGQRWVQFNQLMLEGDVLIIDSSVSTELQRKNGVASIDPQVWSARASCTHPEQLLEIHEQAFKGGADVVVAATYYSSPTVMGAAGRPLSESIESTKQAVSICRRARDKHNPYSLVAGCLSCHPPLMPKGSKASSGKWPNEEVESSNALQHARLLQDAGCDVIVVEMVCDLAHGMRAVAAACSTGLPVFLSFAFPFAADTPLGERVREDIRSGEPMKLGGTNILLSEAVKEYIEKFTITAIFVHQTPFEFVHPALRGIRDSGWAGTVGCYPMSGSFCSPEWKFSAVSDQVLLSSFKSWVATSSAQIIGTGSGMSPNHLQRLSEEVDVFNEDLSYAQKEKVHKAVAAGDEKAVAKLLTDADMQTRQGQTPLHIAAVNNDVQMVKLLIKRGADTTLKDQFALTPSDTAALLGNTDARDYLRCHSQGSRTSFQIRLETPQEPLGIDLRQIEGQSCVRIMGVTAGSVGMRCNVSTGVVLSLGGARIRTLSDVRKVMEELRKSNTRSLVLLVQTDPQYPEGAVVEVMKDLMVSGKVAVKKGSVATVKYETQVNGGGRRVVVHGTNRLDGRTGPVGAMPFEIAHYSAGDVKGDSSVSLKGVYYDTRTSDVVTVTKRPAGGFSAVGSASWSPAVLSAKSTQVTFRGAAGVNMIGVWIGSSIEWDLHHSWELSLSAAAPNTPGSEGLASSQKSDTSMMKMLQKQFTKFTRASPASRTDPLEMSRSIRDPRSPIKTREVPANIALPTFPLHEAARQGDAEVLADLVKQGNSVNNRDANGCTALHIAAFEGCAEVAEALLQMGADTTVRNDEGYSAVELAALRGKQGLRLRLREARQGPRTVFLLKPTSTEPLGLDLKERKTHVAITSVKPNGAATRAKVQPGSIVSLDGKRIKTLKDVLAAVSAAKATQSEIRLVVQLPAPPLCPNGHLMVEAKGVPEDVRAYLPAGDMPSDEEEDLVLACDICEAEDLQESPHYYHCNDCEHDVCAACSCVSEYSIGKTVDVVAELTCKGSVAVRKGTKAIVNGTIVSPDGSRRVIVSAERIDGSAALLGVFPQEIVMSMKQLTSPTQSMHKFAVQHPCEVKAGLAPDAPVICTYPPGVVLTVLEKRRENNVTYCLITCGDSSKDGWVVAGHGMAEVYPEETLQDSVSEVAGSNVSFGLSGLWSGSTAQQPFRDRWEDHFMLYSQNTVKGQFTPPRLDATQHVWATSDIHVDHAANMEWLKNLPDSDSAGNDYDKGTIIVAGDVCTKLSMIREAMQELKSVFQHVFYCVGNHELWQWGKNVPDSLEKFFEIMQLCHEEGVHTVPAMVGDVLICPLQSWYQSNFSEGQEGKLDKMIELFDGGCKWPACIGDPTNERNSLHDGIGNFFLSLNQPLLKGATQNKAPKNCISFSHFIPRTELFPGYKRLNRVMGTTALDTIIKELRSDSMLFCFLVYFSM